MKISPVIKQVFEEIAAASIESANNPDSSRTHTRKMLNIFLNKLNHEEQLFIFTYILNNLHFKNLLMDDDNLLKINNIKLRTVMFVFILTGILFVSILLVFKQNSILNDGASSLFNMLGFILGLE